MTNLSKRSFFKMRAFVFGGRAAPIKVAAISYSLRVVMAATALMAGCMPARAQTAEETVLFMLFGFEAGTTQPGIKVVSLSANRWSVEINALDGKIYSETEIVAAPADGQGHKCVYSVNAFDRGGVLQKKADFDFSRTSTYKVNAITPSSVYGEGLLSEIVVNISGPGLYVAYLRDTQSGEMKASKEDVWNGQVFAPADRMQSAFGYFQRFCPRRGF
jgi:hypothetical protein